MPRTRRYVSRMTRICVMTSHNANSGHHANSRPAGEDVDDEREAEDESGDETGSDDDGEVMFNPPIASTSAAGDEMDKQIRLEREKRETIRMKYTLQRQAEREKIEMQLQADKKRSTMARNAGFSGTRANDVASVQKLLPFMHDTTELLCFFNAFERALEMHNVERVMGKFLPSQLNAKALKAFTSLSAADTQKGEIYRQFWTISNWMLRRISGISVRRSVVVRNLIDIFSPG